MRGPHPVDDKEAADQPTVAILTFDCFDPWLEEIGVSLEAFCNEMMGTWWFNYVQALQSSGIRTVLMVTSSKVDKPTKLTHRPTGAAILVLPSSWAYRLIKVLGARLFRGDRRAARPSAIKRTLGAFLGLIGSYLSTPLHLLHAQLRNEKCNCLLVEQYDEARFDLCVLLARLIGMPVFGTFTAVSPRQRSWMYPFRRLALKLCNGLVICSRIEAKRVMDRYGLPKEKVAVVHYPVDLSVWYPASKQAARAKLGIPAAAKVAIYHGSIELSVKGLDLLLEAWEQVSLQYPREQARLLLVGTGGDAPEVSARISHRGLQVQWVNRWIHDRDELRGYLSAADLYVFPSRMDAFGIAVIEAMACGLPVVAAGAPGMADVLEQGELSGGLVVPSGNPAALAVAIRRAFDDEPFTIELGRRSLQRARAAFSMNVLGRQLREFLLQEVRIKQGIP